MRLIRLLWLLSAALLTLGGYYAYPENRLPKGVTVDSLAVHKAQHRMEAFSEGRLVRTYRIAIGKNPKGGKQYEGDRRTPEGLYQIVSKNAGSGFHKNLGISYPNEQDRAKARKLGKPAGGDVKIHGLKNGRWSWIGKLHRWRDWTNGCIGVTNPEVDELYEAVPIGTPILIQP